MPLFNKLDQFAFAEHRILQVEPGEFILVRQTRSLSLPQDPVVKRTVVFEFKGTERMRHSLQSVTQAVGEIVHRVDAPGVTRALMRNLADPVKGWVTHVDVWCSHIDPGP